MRRPSTLAYCPPPVPTLSVDTVVVTSARAVETAPSEAVKPSAALSDSSPVVPLTDQREATPPIVQAPPRSADPQPPATVRVNVSDTRTPPTCTWALVAFV